MRKSNIQRTIDVLVSYELAIMALDNAPGAPNPTLPAEDMLLEAVKRLRKEQARIIEEAPITISKCQCSDFYLETGECEGFTTNIRRACATCCARIATNHLTPYQSAV